MREKRWAVYVARAVHRFQKWWEVDIQPTKIQPPHKLTVEELTTKTGIEQAGYEGIRISPLNNADRLPPLDVLMVWHAYLLNPRCFFEDCFRYQKMDFFATPFPWTAIDSCIDVITFDFKGTERAQRKWTERTGLDWDNLNDPLTREITCGACGIKQSVAWTSGAQWGSFMDEMTKGNGIADAGFSHRCEGCSYKIDHDHLKVQKFIKDAELCWYKDVPLPGTCLNPDGMPEEVHKGPYNLGKPYNNFPNVLIKGGLLARMKEVDGIGSTTWRMEKVRDGWEDALADRAFLHQARLTRARVIGIERNAVRKVMSRYWHNASPFSLDLAGAVIRQGSFIDKMHDIDWLHSPALNGTMKRLIEKYARFFQIMTNNPKFMAVPTLDVDLAWHTHQLNAADYYRFSVSYAGKYIDHDDKVEEVQLSDSFAWTEGKYQEMFGEPYSECRCWYCEAVREATSSRLDGLFRPKKKEASAKLHEDLSTDPLKSAHISAHNAVRDIDGEAKASVHTAKLDRAYQKAVSKARKKGKPEPRRDEYYAAYYWGYPMPMPIYYPYAVPVGVGTGDCYASDPCTYSSATGSYGACAAGTCGGMAAAGGACAGGAGGGCGSSGGCGGGGGGGCGGGGKSRDSTLSRTDADCFQGGGGGCGGGGS